MRRGCSKENPLGRVYRLGLPVFELDKVGEDRLRCGISDSSVTRAPMRGRLRERVIEGPGVFTLSVNMDDERAGESGQLSRAGIGYNHHAQVSRRGDVAFHHCGAVGEGEAALPAVKL